MVQAVS